MDADLEGVPLRVCDHRDLAAPDRQRSLEPLFGRPGGAHAEFRLNRKKLGAGDGVAGERDDEHDAGKPGGDDGGERRSLAVPEQTDAVRIDSASTLEEGGGGLGVVREVVGRGGPVVAAGRRFVTAPYRQAR